MNVHIIKFKALRLRNHRTIMLDPVLAVGQLTDVISRPTTAPRHILVRLRRPQLGLVTLRTLLLTRRTGKHFQQRILCLARTKR